MQLYLRNHINVDGQAEVIEQSFPVEITEKNGFSYLVFTNEEDEKVIMKCSDEELAVTRFSTPKSTVRFHKDKKALASFPTPAGIQHFVTETSLFKVEQQSVQVDYVLKNPDPESDEIFAEYQLEMKWQ
ncbi:DUF1934 domain-containing protein [Streptococcus caviae]|uniref:DUF1934 domain-containing protein n=1 Tax=Streptococcus sp. 'caviae' TaxID=1915004 RepID=UPI00094BBA8F|nr:DUF1934 domain-containing protein [Streptococcus sp. 'caviae']OLN83652.1 hypothetical protein BMI76_05790 [Streptococcus sp. 'caviae']